MPASRLETNPASRIISLDAQRGLIMILMAIDHAAFFVAKHHPGEFWGYPLPEHEGWLSFLTRHVSHLCAPGFFLLMGTGIALFANSRRDRGWSEARITRHLVVRGVVLLLVQQIIENPAWIIGSLVPNPDAWSFAPAVPGEPGPLILVLAVLTALGCSLIAVGLLQRLPGWIFLLAGIALIVLSQSMVPGPEMVQYPYSPLDRLAFIPGQTGVLLVMYPVVPWLGAALLGAALGKWLARDRDRTLRWVPAAGVALVALFVTLRFIGGFGNTHPWDGTGVMDFLNMTKYPPSIVFLSFAIGTNLLLIGLFERFTTVVERHGGWLLTFGRTALFFYIVHIWLYMLLGLPFRDGTGFGIMYLIWAVGLLMLLPLCRRYETFKAGKPPESVWRLF